MPDDTTIEELQAPTVSESTEMRSAVQPRMESVPTESQPEEIQSVTIQTPDQVVIHASPTKQPPEEHPNIEKSAKLNEPSIPIDREVTPSVPETVTLHETVLTKVAPTTSVLIEIPRTEIDTQIIESVPADKTDSTTQVTEQPPLPTNEARVIIDKTKEIDEISEDNKQERAPIVKSILKEAQIVHYELKPVESTAPESPAREVFIVPLKKEPLPLSNSSISAESAPLPPQNSENASLIIIEESEKIIIGIQNTEEEITSVTTTKKPETEEGVNVLPITSINHLRQTLEIVNLLTQNSDSDITTSPEPVSENKNGAPEIKIVVSEEILEMIEFIRESSDFTEEAILDSSEEIEERSVTFVSSGETTREVVINNSELSDVQEFLVVLEEVSIPKDLFTENQEINSVEISMIEAAGEIIIALAEPTVTENGIASFTDNSGFVFFEINPDNSLLSTNEPTASQDLEETILIKDEEESEKQNLAPVGSILMLEKAIIAIYEVISEMNLDETSSEEQADEIENFNIFEEINLLNAETEIEEKQLPRFNILVSDELITFIESGKEVLERLEEKQDHTSYISVDGKIGDSKELIRLISAEKEIVIELEKLRKLIRIAKTKNEIDKIHSFPEKVSKIAPEEIDVYSGIYQNSNNVAFWFIFQTVLNLLASADDNELEFFNKTGPQLYSNNILHA